MIPKVVSRFIDRVIMCCRQKPLSGSEHLSEAPLGSRVQCQECAEPATVHITEGRSAGHIEELHLCDQCASRYLQEPGLQDNKKTSNPSPEAPRSEGLRSAMTTSDVAASPFRTDPIPALPEVRFELHRIIFSEDADQQVIMLTETEGNRSLPIVIGTYEATAIDRTYRRLPSLRPLTHDAWLDSLIALGASVQAACIKELREQTYFATLRLIHSGQLTEIDVRPSDAVHMALKAKVPVVIPEDLLAEVF